MKGHRVVNATSSPRRWVYGVHAIERRLASQPQTVHEVRLLAARRGALRVLVERAHQLDIPTRDAGDLDLVHLTGTRDHQGVAAATDPFRYADIETVIGRAGDPWLIIDQVQDPHNLGALLRTAAATGVGGVMLPRDGAVGITPTVEKVAAGAAVDLAVCRVVNLSRLIEQLRERGTWSLALVPRGGTNLFHIEIPRPIALVVGGEVGLRPLVERRCDLRASIPLRGGVESLNASVAGAIGMYEILRRSAG